MGIDEMKEGRSEEKDEKRGKRVMRMGEVEDRRVTIVRTICHQ